MSFRSGGSVNARVAVCRRVACRRRKEAAALHFRVNQKPGKPTKRFGKWWHEGVFIFLFIFPAIATASFYAVV
jgi:hypothetical protein